MNKIFFAFGLAFFLLVGSAFGILVQEDRSYVYYINSQEPTIELSMWSFYEEFSVEQAIISLPGEEEDYVYTIDESYQINQEANFSLTLDQFKYQGYSFLEEESLEEGDRVDFELIVTDGEEEISTQGSPKKFQLLVDKEQPEIVYQGNQEAYAVYEEEGSVEIEFSKPLHKLRIEYDGEVIVDERVDEHLPIESYINSFDVSLDNFEAGLVEMEVFMEDISQNTNNETLRIQQIRDDLEISLFTKKDDSQLNYFYSKNHSDLFGDTIYADSQSFSLKLETSAVSTCYYVDSIQDSADISQNSINNLLSQDYETFSTTDGLTHSLNVSPFTEPQTGSKQPFWVGCDIDFMVDQEKFLSESLSGEKRLMFFEYYDEDFSMRITSPGSLVGQERVYVETQTSQAGVCDIEGAEHGLLELDPNENGTVHSEELAYNDGSYQLTYSCFDVMYQQLQETRSFDVDESAGLVIEVLSDYYVDGTLYTQSASETVQFTTSQNPQECRLSQNQINPSITEEFESLSQIDETSSGFEFNAGVSPDQKSTYYIYCSTEVGLVVYDSIDMYYDTQGVSLSNLRFVNGASESQQYVGFSDRITLRLDVESQLPIDFFYASLLGENDSEVFEFSNTYDEANFTIDFTLNSDLEQYSNVAVLAQTLFQENSSAITSSFTISLDGPEVDLSRQNGEWVITCLDQVMECNDLFYGLSNEEGSCEANTQSGNDSINTQGYTYICAQTRNEAGQLSELITKESGSSDASDQFQSGLDEDESLEEDETVDENETTTQDPLQPQDPPEIDDDSNLGYLILAATVLILVAGGSGGWYAYKRGYLDSQLKKMGIPVKGATKSKTSSFTPQSKPQSQKPQLVSKKSKYDQHLNKLNSYLDNALDSKQGVFDNFSSGKSQPTKKKQDGSFDEFYSTSSKKEDSTVEKEAEKFEQYYKNKKNQKNKKKE